MAVSIERGENFYCQVFSSLSEKDLPDEIALAPRVWAGRGLPAIPGEHWERWLGELAFRELRNSFVLTVTAPQPQNGYVVNQNLKKRLDHLSFGLLLQGVPAYRESFLIAGANESGVAEVRQFGRARVFVPSRDLPPLFVGHEELKRALRLADRMAEFDFTGEEWRRLRRGIDALMDGLEEWRYQDARLHEFVRSLEALVLPRQGRSERDFVHRAQTFALASPETQTALTQVYKIRSQVEHLHNALDCLPGTTKEAKEALLYRRGRQLDVLARFSLVRVLEDDTLTLIFKTDADIEAFWKHSDKDRAAIWGGRFDLESVP